MNQITPYKQGKRDGYTMAREQLEQGATLQPDESDFDSELLNAMGSKSVADSWGVTEGTQAFRDCLERYERGAVSGWNDAIKQFTD